MLRSMGILQMLLQTLTNGSSRVLQLVTDALKLQVCNPTFVNGRDAILAADRQQQEGQINV